MNLVSIDKKEDGYHLSFNSKKIKGVNEIFCLIGGLEKIKQGLLNLLEEIE